jgi:hypothetical protein
MRTTSQFRDTRFELVALKQEANGYLLTCVDRSAPGPSAVLDLHESDLTQAEHDAAIALFTILEVAYERRYLGWENDPARAREAVVAAAEAERKRKIAELETLRLEAEAAERTARLTALDEEHAQKRAALAALDDELAAKVRQKNESATPPETVEQPAPQ